MAKTNLLVDRYSLIGNARQVRKDSKGSGAASKFAGHPSLKNLYGDSHQTGPPGAGVNFLSPFDRFRGAAARYWSFGEGATQDDYHDFDYLNRTAVGFSTVVQQPGPEPAADQAFRYDNYIAINVKYIDAQRGGGSSTNNAHWNTDAPHYGGTNRSLKKPALATIFWGPDAF